MPQYTVGQILDLTLKLKVLRAFAINDTVYYIVGVIRKDSVLKHNATPAWGVLRNDGTHDQIPQDALRAANVFIGREKLLDNLE